MKTKIISFAFIAFFFANSIFAQDKTTINASNSEISDNLDLKAVASIFGESKNLEDFERRLNDPKLKISNLDLNYDNQVDYLRVIESIEGRTHLIIIQAILEKDVFQDVATIEVEKDDNNRMQVQVVGDVYMYGNNYIYEPVYVRTPIIFTYLWVSNYRPYYSSWNWGFYPSFYYYWHPFPIYKYRKNVRSCINYNHRYNYVNVRRSAVAINLHRNLRANSYEVRNPERSFGRRNSSVSNRYELDQNRASTRTRANSNNSVSPRNNRTESVAPGGNNRNETVSPRNNRTENVTPRGNKSQTVTPRGNSGSTVKPRNETRSENKESRNKSR
jgi:hypothetical protein